MVAVVDKITFGVPVLALVKSAQQQHGLRHGDYQRYHQYISRKLRRMRKSLHFQQGNRSKVTPKKITPEIMVDPRFIILSVFEVERSWAYAMQLKAESNTELRKRFQMASRLRKAVGRAEFLCNLEDELTTLDPQTKLEIRAYKQWIQGVLYFELQNWPLAKESLESAQAYYNVLSQMMDEDHQAIYKSRIEDLLPQVRYCAYTIGDESAASDLQRMRTQARPTDSSILAELQLDQLLTQAKAGQASQVTQVQWLSMTIPVKSEKAKMAILTVQESDVELSKAEGHQSKLTIYESVLKSCVEAMTSVRDELRTAVASEASVTMDKSTAAVIASAKSGQPLASERVSRLQLLYTYLQYLKLAKTIERTLLHIEVALISGSKHHNVVNNGFANSTYSKPQELSRLYDTIVQNFQELISLPYVIQDHVGFKDLLYTKMIANRSFRCYYLALTYNYGKKYTECLALLGRAQSYAKKALESLSHKASTWNAVEEEAAPGMKPKELVNFLNAFIQQVDAEDLTCRAACMLDDIVEIDDPITSTSDADSQLSQKPLIERLDNFTNENVVRKSLTTLANPFVQSPPTFEPVPVKPIFFDLALNYTSFPSLFDKIDAKATKSSSGLTGLMRGWIWGDSEKDKNTD